MKPRLNILVARSVLVEVVEGVRAKVQIGPSERQSVEATAEVVAKAGTHISFSST